MLTQQVPYNFRVACAHHQSEHVLLIALLLLLLILTVAAYEQEDNKSHEENLYQDAAIEHAETHKGARTKGNACCDEPATDNTKHTSYAEHSALTAPCSICKT